MLALKEINFEIKKGDIVELIGENGAGKSTFSKFCLNNRACHLSNKLYGKLIAMLTIGAGLDGNCTAKKIYFIDQCIKL